MKESSSRPVELGSLCSAPVGVSSPEEVAAARERLLPWLEEQVVALPEARIRERTRRRLRTYSMASAGGLLVAAAAVSLTLWGALEPPPEEPEVEPRAHSSLATVVSGRIFSDSGEFTSGSQLKLRGDVKTSQLQGGAFSVAQGYHVELGPGATLTFYDDTGKGTKGTDIQLHLQRGVAQFSVLPLPAGETLSVATDDAVVTVVGTAFSVEAMKDKPTCVRVTEGRVSVERRDGNRLLEAGDEWGCEVASLPELEEPKPTHRENPPPRTTLAQENALLTKALAAESRGDFEAAERFYRSLLARYPRSSFAQDAQAGLARLKRSIKNE